MGDERINAGPREHHGRELDHVFTAEMRGLRGRIGGLRDPLPVAARPIRSECEDCGLEHTTYATYRQAHRAEDDLSVISEQRHCLGCIARKVAHAHHVTHQGPAVTAVCEEIAK